MVYVLSFHRQSTVEKSKLIFPVLLVAPILPVCGDIGQQLIISFMNIEKTEYLPRDNTDDIKVRKELGNAVCLFLQTS
jgi:hypothetical protein